MSGAARGNILPLLELCRSPAPSAPKTNLIRAQRYTKKSTKRTRGQAMRSNSYRVQIHEPSSSAAIQSRCEDVLRNNWESPKGRASQKSSDLITRSKFLTRRQEHSKMIQTNPQSSEGEVDHRGLHIECSAIVSSCSASAALVFALSLVAVCNSDAKTVTRVSLVIRPTSPGAEQARDAGTFHGSFTILPFPLQSWPTNSAFYYSIDSARKTTTSAASDSCSQQGGCCSSS